MTITNEQLAALEAAFENRYSDPIASDDHYIAFLNLTVDFMPVLIAEARDAKALRAELAHVMAERDAAVKEAEESRPWVMFYRDGKSLGEIAAHFETTFYEFSPWLTAPMMRATREAESYAFAAGRITWLEKAAVILAADGHEDAATLVRALIDEEKGNGNG